MRIFYAVDDTPNLDIDSKVWYYNFYCTFEQMGHEVIRFKYDIYPVFKKMSDSLYHKKEYDFVLRKHLSYALLDQIKKAHKEQPIDLFFSYFYDAFVLPEVIDSIRKMGIKTVNWYCNASYQFDLIKEISPHYDYCLVPEKFRLDDYRKIGATPIFCQEAANPSFYKSEECSYKYNASFIGQAYGDRPSYAKYLHEHGTPIHLFGPRWEHYLRRQPTWKSKVRSLFKKSNPSLIDFPHQYLGGVLSDEEMVKLFSKSKINLGFSKVGSSGEDQKIMQVRLRDFEIPMSGGFYLVEYFEEIKEFYEIGEEIVCFKNREDLLNKIQYFLNNEEHREHIRKAGQKKAIECHSWEHRFNKVFKEVGI